MPISILYLKSSAFFLGDKTSSAGFFLLKIFSFLVIFIFIMAAAFYTTKFIGKHGLPRASAKNMHVIERLSLGVDKTLFIVRVGDAYYLISATKQAVTLLDKLEKNCLIEDGENPSENILKTRFSVYFDKFLNTKSKMSVEDDQDFDFQYNDDFTESLKSRLADLKKRSDEIKGLSDKDENR